MRQHEPGFTLIEMVVAVFVITLLLGSILVPLTTQVAQRQISDTQKTMEEIKEALIGFAVANRYLPCPDTDGDGISNPAPPYPADPAAPVTCTPPAEGFVPWATLSVASGDAWGNRFRYRVTTPEFTNSPLLAGTCAPADGRIGLCDSGNITVNTRVLAAGVKVVQALTTTAIAVIVSHGRNGYGATTTSNIVTTPVPAVNLDETANAGVGSVFWSRPPIGVSLPCSETINIPSQPFCEFDDIVTWISPFTLFNRMAAAGKLP